MQYYRQEYNEIQLRNDFSFVKIRHDNPLLDALHYIRKYFKPNKKNCQNFLRHLFPIISWLPKYKPGYLLKDFLGGVTIGFLQIAQSIN